MAREYLRWTPETTWGTYASGNPHVIINLDQNNAFTMRPKPVTWSIRTMGSFNRRWQTGSAKTAVGGNLNILCYGSQMANILPQVIATSGNVLTSATIDHAIVMDDSGGTTVYRRYLGCMVNQGQFTAGEQNQLLRLNMQLTAQKPDTITITDFAEPAVTAYPLDAPYVFEMASGAFTLASSRTEFEEFDLTVKNTLDPRFMASQYLTRLKFVGRDVDFTCRFPYIISTDRSAFEAITAASASIAFTNGAHAMTFNFNSNNYRSDVQDDLAMDKVFLQTVSMSTYFDSAAGTPNDLTYTVS